MLWTVGIDSISADYFRTWYHRSDLVHYLEALDDHTIVETHATGQWTEPERLVFAVEGIDYTHNRYYIDGFRVDDRFQPGSTLYRPDMQAYNLQLNTHTGQLYFERDSCARDYVQASYNFGQISNGEPMPGTAALIHLFHRTPMESADTWQHITARRHYRGAGTAEAAFSVSGLRQHVYAAYGQREITKQDHRGFMPDDPTYTTYYYKAQADGDLWLRRDANTEHKLAYRLNFSGRGDGGSEFFYNHDEVYDHKNYGGSIYYTRKTVSSLTTGLTWSTNVIHHADRSFARNIIDQDGESFEPWIPDGKTHELTWALNYDHRLLPWLRLQIEGYNSFFYFTPEVRTWSNDIYLQSPVDEHPSPCPFWGKGSGERGLQWSSSPYASGLLENTVTLRADYTVNPTLDIHGVLGLSLDGMLLGHGQSKVSPNLEASFGLDVHPCRWFEMGVGLAHHRLAYTTDYLRFFSPDYMSYGSRHRYAKGLSQTAYLMLDIPIRFHFRDRRGVHHEFALHQSYKRFYNVWYVQPDESTTQPTLCTMPYALCTYTIGTTPSFGSNPLLNGPYYFSQLTRYTLTGRYIHFSLSWQSMQCAGYAALGNGPNANNNGVLSETTALPSTTQVVTNPNGKYPGVGRTDLDKGFVCRIYFAANTCRYFQLGFTAKWTDGKPFTAYRYELSNSKSSNCPIILPFSSRGTNPTDGNFGTRHCANWQIDLHAQGSWWIRGHQMTARLECYNVWDFCCDQAEMSFTQDIPQANRASMIMNVPTGLLLTLRAEL